LPRFRASITLGEPGETNPVILGVWAHWALARIHPFHDGNGRLARLWQDMVFFRAGVTCAIIRPEDRREYLDALGKADEGDLNPLLQLTARRMLRTFDHYLAVLRNLDGVKSWAEKIGETDARAAEKRTLAYERWRRTMLRLRDDFILCAATLSEHSPTHKAQVRSMDVPDQQAWETILAGQGSPTTFFTVHVTGAGSFALFSFSFEKHYWTAHDSEADKFEPIVALRVRDDADREAVWMGSRPRGCSVTLREIFSTAADVVRVVGPSGPAALHDIDNVTYQRGVSSLQIARDFLTEAVRNLSGK